MQFLILYRRVYKYLIRKMINLKDILNLFFFLFLFYIIFFILFFLFCILKFVQLIIKCNIVGFVVWMGRKDKRKFTSF